MLSLKKVAIYLLALFFSSLISINALSECKVILKNGNCFFADNVYKKGDHYILFRRSGDSVTIPISNVKKINGKSISTKEIIRKFSNNALIGSKREEILKIFNDWKRDKAYEQNVDPLALKFTNKDLIVVVDFDKGRIAEGVSFLSMNVSKNAYTNLHFDDLILWATGGRNFKIEKNYTTSNLVEIYIGKTHLERQKKDTNTNKEINRNTVDESKHNISKAAFATGLVSSVPGIINAWWSSNISLWIQVDVAYLSKTNPKIFAKQIADMISGSASNKFGFTCVHVYYGNLRELAKSCN